MVDKKQERRGGSKRQGVTWAGETGQSRLKDWGKEMQLQRATSLEERKAGSERLEEIGEGSGRTGRRPRGGQLAARRAATRQVNVWAGQRGERCGPRRRGQRWGLSVRRTGAGRIRCGQMDDMLVREAIRHATAKGEMRDALFKWQQAIMT